MVAEKGVCFCILKCDGRCDWCWCGKMSNVCSRPEDDRGSRYRSCDLVDDMSCMCSLVCVEVFEGYSLCYHRG